MIVVEILSLQCVSAHLVTNFRMVHDKVFSKLKQSIMTTKVGRDRGYFKNICRIICAVREYLMLKKIYAK